MSDLLSIEALNAFFDPVPATAPPLSAADRLAMLELTSRFEWAFDSRRLDALETLLTEDVVIDHLFGLAVGRPAAMRMLREDVPFEGIRHQATNAVCFVDAQARPCVLSYLLVVQVADPKHASEASLPRLLAHAVVTDVMRKERDGWRIAGRTFEQMRLSKDYAGDESSWRKVAETAGERGARRRKEQGT